ncbi:recombinase family protein [Georgenia yuyongxinii]|uniref:recombinase family protein n=1 Tax=Georgenia yuyongxinii TaxID=2589797 RepID=UPI003AF7BDA3
MSTTEQNVDLQVDALEAAGAVRVFVEHASGATRDRPELRRCLDHLDPGDTLACWRIDRLGRSVADLVSIVNDLAGRGVEFRSLTEGIDTLTPGGELVFTIMAAIAQMERRLIQERTLAGLQAARARGRVGGRPRALTEGQVAEARRMRDEGRSVAEIAGLFRVARSTLAGYLTPTTVG